MEQSPRTQPENNNEATENNWAILEDPYEGIEDMRVAAGTDEDGNEVTAYHGSTELAPEGLDEEPRHAAKL